MKLIFFDTETTGLEPEDKVIQIGTIIVDGDKDPIRHESLHSAGGRKISIQAMATHHITEEMIDGKYELEAHKERYQGLFDSGIAIAHNAKFDIRMMAQSGINIDRFICTRKVAYKMFKKEESHALQRLRYSLGLYKLETERIDAHSALSDCVVLQNLFNHMKSIALKLVSEEEMYEKMIKTSKQPMFLRKFGFGKYAKKEHTIAEVAKKDFQYIKWLWNKSGMPDTDEDLKYTLQQYIT